MFYFNSLECVKFAVATSTLKKSEKKIVIENVLALKGTMLDTWKPNCNTLVVKEIMLTPKVLTCIIWGTPVVTPKYFVDFLRNVHANQTPPDPKNYVPPCGEAVLPQKSVTLDYNPARKNLFANKVFVFSNKAIWDQMTGLIQAAAGKSVLFDGSNVTVNTLKNSSEQYLFLNDSDAFGKTEKIQPILEYLTSIDHRVIPLQEIAIAILHGSCSKNCNPEFKKAEKLLENADKTFSCGDALVLGTQTQSTEADVKIEEDNVVVPPSYENPIGMDCTVNGGVKRQGDALKRVDVGAKVTKTAAAADIHQKKTKTCDGKSNSNVPSPKKLTQPSITSFIQIDKPRPAFSLASTTKSTENPYKRKLSNTGKAVERAKISEVIEIINDDDDEEENIFKKPKIEKEKPSKVNKNTKESNNVLSSTVLSQNDSIPSFCSLDMSTIKHEKVADNGRPSITVGSNKSSGTSSVKKDDLDPELEEFINSFKNTSIIKIKNCVALERSRVSVNDSRLSSNSAFGVKNFKKFRKVSICVPQKPLSNFSFSESTGTPPNYYHSKK